MTAAKEWKHWFVTLDNFFKSLEVDAGNKLILLINHVDYIAEYDEYGDVIEILRDMYIKPKNKIFALHTLDTRKQKSGETID